jgi:hypothetical protein
MSFIYIPLDIIVADIDTLSVYTVMNLYVEPKWLVYK